MMHPEKWICKRCIDVNACRNGDRVYADEPFGDHLGPPEQFDGAFPGHVPPRSLQSARDEK